MSNYLLLIYIIALSLLWGCKKPAEETPLAEKPMTVGAVANSIIADTGTTKVSLSTLGLHITSRWETVTKLACTINEDQYQITISSNQTSKINDSVMLYLLSITGVDKGENVLVPQRRYVLKYADKLYVISMDLGYQESSNFAAIYQQAAQKMGCELNIDATITIPELQIQQRITAPNGTVLERSPQELMVGVPNKSILTYLFETKSKEAVYTTNQEKSHIANNPLDFKSDKLNVWINSAVDAECFGTHKYYLFRKDGTFVQYDILLPRIAPDSIQLSGEHSIGFTEYTSQTLTTCEAKSVADATPLSSSFIQKNPLEFLGMLHGKDSIWTFQKISPILGTAYSILQDAENYWEENCGDLPSIEDFETFCSKNPMLVMKDSFGRHILYKISALNPPACCEPVFYLYSPKALTVNLTLKNQDIVRTSSPAVKDNGWTIYVNDSGMASEEPVRRTIPYVFWEGWVGALPKPNNGFCVEAKELQQFFQRNLKILGLKTNEIEDFVRVWLSKCPKASYYAVHFYDTEFANNYCPISITPKPQTMIRIYVDIQPSETPIKLLKQNLKSNTKRIGLTYVEWGAIVRE